MAWMASADLTQEPVPPGGSFDYRFTPPDSGLFWYHPQVLPFAREQQGRGLYGVMIVDEENPPQADRDCLSCSTIGSSTTTARSPISTRRRRARLGALLTVNARAIPVRKRCRRHRVCGCAL